MTRQEKIRILQSIRNGQIKVEDIKNALEEDLNACGAMFIQEKGGWDSSLGFFTDEQFEAWQEKISAINKRRNLLGMPEIISMIVIGSSVDVIYGDKLKHGGSMNEDDAIQIFIIPDNGRAIQTTTN